jgi:hypothetical protein
MALTRRRPTRYGVVVAALALLVALPACSGGGGASIGGGPGATTTTVPPFFPLTGLPATDARTVTRPAVTVKIENSPASRPQAGLAAADVVIEAIVEGGQTRFLAVFHATDSEVGPIRSVRPADPALVAPFGGVVAFSGGIPRFVTALRQMPVTAVDENNAGDAFRRRRDRSAPHNLYGTTEALRDKVSETTDKPPPRFATFLAPGEAWVPAGAVPVATASFPVGSTNVAYAWDAASGTWKRSTNGTPHMVEGGGQVSPTTVIVQFTPYEPTGEVDTTGAQVFEAKVVGTGEAVIFANGTSVRARWSKTAATSMTVFTDAAGAPISLPAGRTWVELATPGAPVTTA